jgi:hypothetical protein
VSGDKRVERAVARVLEAVADVCAAEQAITAIRVDIRRTPRPEPVSFEDRLSMKTYPGLEPASPASQYPRLAKARRLARGRLLRAHLALIRAKGGSQ